MERTTNLTLYTLALLGLSLSLPLANALPSPTYYVSGSLGTVMSKVSATDEVPGANLPAPQLFVGSSKQASTVGIGFEGGVQFALAKRWTMESGLQYAYTFKQTFTGDYYTRPASPVDLTYEYGLQSHQLIWNNQWLYAITPTWSGYTALGLGMAALKTTAVDFTSADREGHTVPLNSSVKSHTSFVWQWGVGARYRINPHWSLQAGLTQKWLGSLKLPFNDDVTNQVFSAGEVTPLSLTIGAHYEF